MLLRVVMASCVSGASVYLLLRLRMCPQSLEGFVLNVSESSSCFHFVCCSCWISSDISLFSVCIRLRISGVGNCRLRWFRACIFNLVFLLIPGLKCLTAPVGIYCLLLRVMTVVKSVVAVSMLVIGEGKESARSCSILLVNDGQSALL